MPESQSTAPIPTTNAITGVILAGGRARRMGGEDKGLTHVDGQPLIRRVIERIRPQVGNIVINANRNLEEYAQLGFPVVHDQANDFRGPLAGMAAAMAAAKTPFILVVPCDSPHLPLDLVERLASAMTPETDLCYAASPERDQPVYALLRQTLLPSLMRYLNEDGRKIDRWYARHPNQRVLFPAEADFANINAPEDIDRYLSSV